MISLSLCVFLMGKDVFPHHALEDCSGPSLSYVTLLSSIFRLLCDFEARALCMGTSALALC